MAGRKGNRRLLRPPHRRRGGQRGDLLEGAVSCFTIRGFWRPFPLAKGSDCGEFWRIRSTGNGLSGGTIWLLLGEDATLGRCGWRRWLLLSLVWPPLAGLCGNANRFTGDC